MATEQKASLTLKQRLFVEHYLGEFKGNATAAARAAGYRKPSEQGYENLRKPQIRAAIDEWLNAHSLTAAQVLAGLSQQANATLEHFLVFEEDGSLRIDLTTEQAKANLHLLKNAKVKRRTGGTGENAWVEVVTEIELHDVQTALVALGNYHGLFRRSAAPVGASVTTLSTDGRSSVTVSGYDTTEVRLLALHNDLIRQALTEAEVDIPDNLLVTNTEDEGR